MPRAQIPTKVTAENVQSYLSSTSSNSASSTVQDADTLSSDRSTYRTTYDPDVNATMNSTFFKELDQTMGAKLRATIARPDAQGILSSLPPMIGPRPSITSTTLTTSTDDPIDELDAVIDNEDIDLSMTFHDPLDDLFDNEEMLEVINPNLRLPRPQVDSKPTGLFSVIN